MTIGQVKAKITPLLDEKSLKAFTMHKIIPLLDMGQKIVIFASPVKKKYKIAQSDITQRYVLQNPEKNFEIQNRFAEVCVGGKAAKAYYLAVDDDAEVFIEVLDGGLWVPRETIVHTKTNGFTAYKGLLPGNEKDTRIRFGGQTFYRYRNIALWDIAFSSVDSVPNFQEYTDYQMPDDFYKVMGVYVNGGFGQGQTFHDFGWETPKTLRLPYSAVGEFIVEYEAYPQTIPPDADDTFELTVSPEAEAALLNYVASQISIDDTNYAKYFSQFQGIMQNLNDGMANTAVAQSGLEWF